jgi:hypothetical protein
MASIFPSDVLQVIDLCHSFYFFANPRLKG